MASTSVKSKPAAKAAKTGDKPAAKASPKAAKDTASSFEVLRAWVADGDLHTDFISNLWDPDGYGTFLADLARQISDGILEDNPGLKSASVLAAIRQGFLAEIDKLSEAEMVRRKK